tara:strand:+ start:930 stop:1478 length:549 start_codon:yes stop_codon:yes gene_type:complete
MAFTQTNIKDLWIFEPRIFEDDRGYFFESFNENSFQKEIGISVHFVQDNQSKSDKGVLRGLHYQTGEHAQAKLVRVLKGSVLDVAVDLREGSSTFGEHFAIELSENNKKQLFIPRGFAHGFLVLEDNTIFVYKCDNFYNKDSEDGIIYNDKDLAIDWKMKEAEFQLSEKDVLLPTLSNHKRI